MARKHDRIRLKNTYHNYAKFLERFDRQLSIRYYKLAGLFENVCTMLMKAGEFAELRAWIESVNALGEQKATKDRAEAALAQSGQGGDKGILTG